MSAIFGILRFDGGAVAARDLERMGNVLAHRGPDGRKFATDGPAGLGHCLMRVNQEDSFEAQPLRDRDADLSMVADCRIDNREELAGIFGIGAAELRDTPDGALVLRAFKKWGEACAEHLLGDFAFAVWDGRAKKLVLARDHMGQRNVYYHKGEDFFAFATEIKALWTLAEVPRQLLDQEIARLFFNVQQKGPEGRTFYAGVHSVPGGTIIVTGPSGTITSRQYWEPHADPVHEGRDESYYVEKYRSVLAEAVACRLRRLTGPAALLMSAGFDSAAIAGLAGPVVTAQRRKLISLSWFGSKATETEYGNIRPWLEACRRVMPHLDIREASSEGENPLVGIERRFLINEGPAHSHHNITDHLFAKASKAGARLIMDGFGGDYSLNPRGHGALARHLRHGQFRRFLTELRPHLQQTGRSPWRLLKYDIILMQLPVLAVRWQRRIRRQARWGRSALLSLRYGSALRYVQGPYLEELQKQNAAEAKPGFESLPITAMRARMRDIASAIGRGSTAGGAVPAAAHGLDLTRPFHDKRVLEFGLAIPEDLYVKNGLNRYLARLALTDVYPREFQTRGRRNEGVLSDDLAILNMATPELLAEADRLANNPKLSGYFDFERVQRLLSLPGPNRRGPTTGIKFAAMNAVLTARFIDWFSPSNSR
jgi:asparagine synthase (glutamine-hydrolysing)